MHYKHLKKIYYYQPKTKMLKLTKLATAQNKYPEIETYNFYLQAFRLIYTFFCHFVSHDN